MDADLLRLIREHYPFPIAHAHKKTLALLDDDAQKLKCIIQAAEVVIQFLALAVLAQLNRDLEHQRELLVGPRLGTQVRDNLRNPSFGKWQEIAREVLKSYRNFRHLLVVPELYDFYFAPSRGTKLVLQPVVTQAIDPLIALRNRFHHPGIPEAFIPAEIDAGLGWLEQLLDGLQFLSAYPLAFIQEIRVRHPTPGSRQFSHDLMQLTGCFTVFDHQRWESDLDLHEERVILLAPEASGRSLLLDPFLTVSDRLLNREVLDVFLLNGVASRRVRYLSAQFVAELTTDQTEPAWPKGAGHLEALARFFDLLRRAPTMDAELEVEWDGNSPPIAGEDRATQSTEAVFAVQYQREAPSLPPRSPYKFLDYFEPEDADLFFGREQETRELQRKFHASRLLVLHGESGTGKTSLIRAGLIPQLPPEIYVPVYVRALQEPTQAIKEEMIRQLGVDRRHVDLPLAAFLDAETAYLSKTVVLILDQFEEFFLRFPIEVRQRFHHDLKTCLDARLDVHVLIALREDYFGLLDEFRDAIPHIFTHRMQLSRLTQSQAFAAAVEPVKRVGLSMDETLMAEVILPQLDEPEQGIEPPLLQIVCDALYQHAQNVGRPTIGDEDYAAIGDVQQALGRYLDDTLRQFGQAQPQARAVLKALVTAAGTKRASVIEEITSRLHTTGLTVTPEVLERDFLHQFVQARLVRADELEGHTRYELTHEFLVQQIGTWIADNERELTKVLELIDRAYEAYWATDLPLQPEALALIAPFEAEFILPPEKQRFLEVSHQADRQRRRGLLLKVGVLLFAVVVAIGSVAGWELYHAYRRAEANARQAERSFQHTIDAANTMVQDLAYGLKPVMGTRSVTLERILQNAENVFERVLEEAGESPAALAGKVKMLFAYSDVAKQLGNTGRALSRAQQARSIAAQLTQQDSDNTQWRYDLAVSHDKIGDILMSQGSLSNALKAYQDSLRIAEQLVQQDSSNNQWQQALAESHNNMGTILVRQGSLSNALKAYQDTMRIRQQLARQEPSNKRSQHDLAKSHYNIGSVLTLQGKLNDALKAYQVSLRIWHQLAQQDPSDIGWQDGLAMSHNEIGNILATQGNLSEALEAYQASLHVRQQLAREDPRNTLLQASLLVSYSNIGSVSKTQGNLSDALEAYQASLHIAEKLAQQDPSNAQWQHGLAASHDQIGNVLMAQGNLSDALEAYQASLHIAEQLVQQDPNNLRSQHKLSVSQDRIGSVLMAQGNLSDALKAFWASLRIAEKLAQQDPSNAQLQQSLAASHDQIGSVLMAQSNVNDALKAFQASLRIAEKLAQQDPSNAQWQHGLAASHDQIGNVLMAQSNVNDALKAFQASLGIRQLFAQQHPSDILWQEGLAASQDRIGNVLALQGNLSDALEAFRASLHIAEKLVQQAPSNAQWQHGLALSHNNIGNVLATQGNLSEALKAFQASLHIRQQLAQQDPSNAQWQDNLAVLHNNIGNVLKAQGHLSDALEAYKTSLRIRQQLAQQDPSNAYWQNSLLVSHDQISNVLVAQGARNKALKAYQASLHIRQQLSQQNPSNTQWQQGLADNHIKIGDILKSQSKPNDALKAYQASLRIAEQLAQQDPSNAQWQQGLATSYERIGDILAIQGDRNDALKAFQVSLRIRQQLVQQNPDNNQSQLSLLLSHIKIGDILKSQGNPNDALKAFQVSLRIAEQLVQQDPSNALLQNSLLLSHIKIGDILKSQGNLSDALEAYQASLRIAEQLAQQDPSNAQWQNSLLVSHDQIGNILMTQGNLGDALMAYQASLHIAEQLTQQEPGNAQWRYELGMSHAHVAHVMRTMGNTDEALQAFDNALSHFEDVAQKAPRVIQFVYAPLSVYSFYAEIQTQQKDFAGVLQTYRKAIAYADLLAQREPENAQWQHELALALNGYAWTLLTAEPDDLRNPTEALTLAQRAIQLAELMPQTARAALLDTLAMAHHLTGNHARAIQVAEQGLAMVPASDQKTIQLRQELETHLAAFRAAQQQRSSQ